jgi:TRAP-type mannitol/chloroaromatic compound transport system permease small subunit
VLLLPFSGFLLWSSWDYVAISWQIREASPEAGGLPYPFLPIMKSAIPMTAFMLTLQGIALMLDSLTTLNTRARATT